MSEPPLQPPHPPEPSGPESTAPAPAFPQAPGSAPPPSSPTAQEVPAAVGAPPVDACLRRHNLPRLPVDLGLTDEQFAQAVAHAPQTRPDRYTILEHLDLDATAIRARTADYVEVYRR